MTAKELKAKLDAAKVKYKKGATIPELEALLKAYEDDKAARDAAQGTTPPSAPEAPASDTAAGDGMELPPGAEIVSNPTATKEGKIDVYGIKDDGKYGYVRTFAADRHGKTYLEMAEQFVANNPGRMLQLVNYSLDASRDRGGDK